MSEDKDTVPTPSPRKSSGPQDRESEVRQLKEEAMTLIDKKRAAIVEREDALEGLKEVEGTFSDVHRDYERAKEVLENAKRNEKVLRKRDKELLHLIDAKEHKLVAFKKETERVVQKMNRDFMTKLNALHQENAKVVDSLRLTEIQATALKSQVEEKQTENEGLTQLAERLIGGTAIAPGPAEDAEAEADADWEEEP